MDAEIQGKRVDTISYTISRAGKMREVGARRINLAISDFILVLSPLHSDEIAREPNRAGGAWAARSLRSRLESLR